MNHPHFLDKEADSKRLLQWVAVSRVELRTVFAKLCFPQSWSNSASITSLCFREKMNLGYLITGQCPKDYSPTVEGNKAISRLPSTCEVFGNSGLFETKIWVFTLFHVFVAFSIYFLSYYEALCGIWGPGSWQFFSRKRNIEALVLEKINPCMHMYTHTYIYNAAVYSGFIFI